ncbi:MAG: sigma-54-dependent Fis family transcriptional regulator [Planctomycetes bacterium]|nr:sigma-54-dependent Fis family transcriptional regulator [Planctomycetota bacterium]
MSDVPPRAPSERAQLPEAAGKHRGAYQDEPAGLVLLLIDDATAREQAILWLEEVGYAVLVAGTREEALALIGRRLDIDVVVAEVGHAAPVLDAAERSPAGLEVVLCGAADVFVITEAIAHGAVSFLPHPMTQTDLLLQVMRALRAARRSQLAADKRAQLALAHDVHFEGIVGTTPRMVEVMEVLRKASPTDAPIVILGESGTGKELIARAIHVSSPRRSGPFVALHLYATPEGLIESELFGHKKGAFTGALGDRAGKLEMAHGGTLFLDELGDIPLETQTKLLRVLETRTFEPVGSNRSVTADFRLVAATNLDIPALIAEKKFREELWYRLNVVRVQLPSLRERRADIAPLVERFAREFAEAYGKRFEGADPEVMTALRRHAWPGNIRELRNVVQRMVVMADGPRLTARDLPRELRGAEPVEVGAPAAPIGLAGRPMDEIEKEAIRETLRLTDGNRKAAADLLQIGERTLYRKIEKFGL